MLYKLQLSIIHASFSPVEFIIQESSKGATKRITHLEKNCPIFSSLSFVIRLNLPQWEPSLFRFSLLLLLWCFSALGSYYFEVSFNVKVILPDQKNVWKYRDIAPLNDDWYQWFKNSPFTFHARRFDLGQTWQLPHCLLGKKVEDCRFDLFSLRCRIVINDPVVVGQFIDFPAMLYLGQDFGKGPETSWRINHKRLASISPEDGDMFRWYEGSCHWGREKVSQAQRSSGSLRMFL